MFEPSSKKALLAVLVASFVVQTGLVYSDDVDIVLSEDAVQGRKLFHDGASEPVLFFQPGQRDRVLDQGAVVVPRESVKGRMHLVRLQALSLDCRPLLV